MEIKQEALTIFLLLGGGTFLLIFLLSLLFLFIRVHLKRIRMEEQQRHLLALNHQKELSIATIEVQERERARIAGELHDDLIAQLYRIKLSNKDAAISTMLKQSIQKARGLSHDLSPPMLEKVSIETLFLDFLQPFRSKYEIQTHFGAKENKPISKELKLQLFRIFQELITNVDKHAKASKIELYYRFYDSYLCFMLRDDGLGFQVEEGAGLGLKNIALRTQLFNGSYKIKSNTPQGTTFILVHYDNIQR